MGTIRAPRSLSPGRAWNLGAGTGPCAPLLEGSLGAVWSQGPVHPEPEEDEAMRGFQLCGNAEQIHSFDSCIEIGGNHPEIMPRLIVAC